MEASINEIEVNGQTYVKEKEFCIIRTYSAGVFAGYIKRDDVTNKTATIYKSRRLWLWSGAASLSQLAVDGTSKPNDCKFPCSVGECDLTEIIEIIPCTSRAKVSIEGVPVWSC